MMCIPFEEKQSSIHGMGVFTKEFVPKGTVVWKYNPIVDKTITESELATLQDYMQAYVKHFSYHNEDVYVFCGDGGRFMNHSENPNTQGFESEDGFGVSVASRDIQAGEEITGDYDEFDADFERKKTENPLVL